MKAFNLSLVCFCVALLAIVPSCGRGKAADDRPIVVVTLAPQAYFVERLAGDSVQVEVMIPPGVGHATYEPTSRQLSALAQARMYAKIGYPSFSFETAWLDKVLSSSPELRVVDSSAGGNRDDDDPHFWLAPDGARLMARNIASGLSLLLPEKSPSIFASLSALEKDIDALDAEIRALLAGAQGKRFYVFHPAFGHFARQYGLEQVAIEQGHKEPTPDELRRVLQAAKADGARAILVQPQYSKEAAGVVAAETGAPLVEVDPESRQWLTSTRQAAQAIADALPK